MSSKKVTKKTKFVPWSHQEETRHKMIAREYEFLQSTYDKKNIAILCNDIGTGKTATALAHISAHPTIEHDYDLENNINLPKCLEQIVREYLKMNLWALYENMRFFKSHFFHFHLYPEPDDPLGPLGPLGPFGAAP